MLQLEPPLTDGRPMALNPRITTLTGTPTSVWCPQTLQCPPQLSAWPLTLASLLPSCTFPPGKCPPAAEAPLPPSGCLLWARPCPPLRPRDAGGAGTPLADSQALQLYLVSICLLRWPVGPMCTRNTPIFPHHSLSGAWHRGVLNTHLLNVLFCPVGSLI